MSNERETAGKTVFVSGGGRGIGEAIVRAAAADGYDVTFTYRTAAEEAASLVRELQDKHPGGTFSALQVDFGERSRVDDLADKMARWKGLYGFVHNAGASADALTALLDQDKSEAIMQINFWSMTRLIKAAIRPMMRARAGRIVTIGSITADYGAKGNAAYAATKGAMASYVRTLAIEVAAKGVTANIIAPGYVDTDMMAGYGEQRAEVEKLIPTGRFVRPDEVGALTSFLLSDRAGSITGATVTIDGGLTAAVGVNNKS